MVVIFWLAILATVAVLLYMEWWPKHVFQKVEIKRKLEHMSVHVGESVQMKMSFKNNKIMPIHWMEITSTYSSSVRIVSRGESCEADEMAEGTEIAEAIPRPATAVNAIDNTIHRVLLSLRSFHEIEETYDLSFTKRGRYTYHETWVKSGDLFGMQVNYGELPCPMEIYVYPKLYPLEQLLLNNQTFMGEVVVKRWIIDDPLLISGVRDYTLGDPMKSIHWHATARTGTLQVRKNLYTADLAAMVILNVKTKVQFVEGADVEVLERLVEIAAAAVVQLDKNKVPVGFSANCPLSSDIGTVMIPPGLGSGQYHRIFCALAQVGSYVSQAPETLLAYITRNSHHNEKFIFVTAIITPEIMAELKMAVRKGHDLEVITTAEAVAAYPGIHQMAKVKIVREEVLEHVV